MEEVAGVHLLEFGIPEAMWHLRVHDFAAIVTMDAHGNSLHASVEQETAQHLAEVGAANERGYPRILAGASPPVSKICQASCIGRIMVRSQERGNLLGGIQPS